MQHAETARAGHLEDDARIGAARTGLPPVPVNADAAVRAVQEWTPLPRKTPYPGNHRADDVLAEHRETKTQDGNLTDDIDPFEDARPAPAPGPPASSPRAPIT